MIAFHFPPSTMGSGHLRTLGFARYLPACGWNPVVLSAHPLAYAHADEANNRLIPQGCHVHRALALDVRRHLGFRGKYPAFLAQPDRWAPWWLAAVVQGLRLIRRHHVDAIWSTYPIMSAHRIAHTLSRRTGLPWIADFRDPVTSSVEPGNRFSVASQARHEKRVLATAERIVFTTPGAMRGYAARFPRAAEQGRLAVVSNGYDERAFVDLPVMRGSGRHERRLRFVHSGVLYPCGRNPGPFLTALARLRANGTVCADELEIVLRAAGSETTHAPAIRALGLDDMVRLAPAVSNADALREQAGADALLLFQGRQFDRQIPAKVYEYLRMGRPILALTSRQGDTASLLRQAGGAQVLPMDDVTAIESTLPEFVRAVRDGDFPAAVPKMVEKYSRREGARRLARMLGEVAG